MLKIVPSKKAISAKAEPCVVVAEPAKQPKSNAKVKSIIVLRAKELIADQDIGKDIKIALLNWIENSENLKRFKECPEYKAKARLGKEERELFKANASIGHQSYQRVVEYVKLATVFLLDLMPDIDADDIETVLDNIGYNKDIEAVVEACVFHFPKKSTKRGRPPKVSTPLMSRSESENEGSAKQTQTSEEIIEHDLSVRLKLAKITELNHHYVDATADADDADDDDDDDEN